MGWFYSLATGRSTNKTSANIDVVLVHAADIAGVLIVVDNIWVVAAGLDGDGGGTGNNSGASSEGPRGDAR
jgi:hypothetical protein